MQPLPAAVIPLSVAQRYSVLVTARNDTSNNWAIHANMDPDMFDRVPPTLQLSKPFLRLPLRVFGFLRTLSTFSTLLTTPNIYRRDRTDRLLEQCTAVYAHDLGPGVSQFRGAGSCARDSETYPAF